MRRIIKPLVFSFFLITLFSNAQDVLWEKSFGGKHDEILSDIIPTPDNGFIFAGSSISNNSGNKTIVNRGDFDYWVWKMDEKGELEWQKGFGGEGNDILQSIILTKDGGFLLGGTSASNKSFDKKEDSRGQNDFWIIKLNAKGDEEWQKTIGGEWQDDLQSVIRTIDDGFLIGGTSASNMSFDKNSSSFGNLDYWLVKIDSKGTIEWQKSYGGIYADELKSISQTSDNGFIVGGNSNSIVSGNKTEEHFGLNDYWVLKLDNSGNLEWQKTIGGNKDDQLTTIFQTKNKEYIIGGSSNSNKSNSKGQDAINGTDFWIVKLNEDAEIIEQHVYDFGKVDLLTSLIENISDTYLIGGYTKSEIKLGSNSKKKDDEGVNDFMALKIDIKGNEVWKKTIGSNGNDVIKKVIETRDGSYILGGTSNPMQSRFIDYDNKAVGKNDLHVKNFLAENNVVNDEIDASKKQLKNDLNSEINKNANELKSRIGISEDSPFKLKTNENSLTDGFLNGNSSTKNEAKKQENKLPASREKNNNFGNSDFWVIKLKDKEKPKVVPFTIEAYPNPTVHFTNVIIGYKYETGTILVADLAGHVLQQFEIKEKTIPIDFSTYPDGIYIVSVKTNVQENSIKIIKGNNKL